MGAFTLFDALIVVAYLVGTTILGVWLGRGQKSARDYFVADKAIPWWAILFSVVATETSALTFISIPSVAYLGDFTYLQIALGYLIGRIVIAYTLLPRYYEGQLVTAYALLEKRFGGRTRRFASVIFMGTRAFGDSVRIFATAIPVALILGGAVPQEYIGPASILTLGLFTVIYTFHGGIKAVVWTDVIQTVVYLLGGAAALYLIGNAVTGGWSGIIAQASAADKTRVFDLYLGLDRPQTLFVGMLGGAFLSMASHGADQIIVQRLLASNNLKDARAALIGSGIAVILQFTLFLFIGMGLWALYAGREFASPDHIFPTFIVEGMPPGLTGLVIAAILAAAMSTVSGSLNSLAAASIHDIYLPLTKRTLTDLEKLRAAKRATLFWAVILIGGALLYRQQGTPVVIIALSIASFTYGGLLGGFFLGILWRRANQRDAITGMSVALASMALVVFAGSLVKWVPAAAPVLQPLVGRFGWPLYVLIGTSITLLVGIVSSYTHAAPPAASGPDALRSQQT